MGISVSLLQNTSLCSSFWEKNPKNKAKQSFLGQVSTKYMHEIFVLENVANLELSY